MTRPKPRFGQHLQPSEVLLQAYTGRVVSRSLGDCGGGGDGDGGDGVTNDVLLMITSFSVL